MKSLLIAVLLFVTGCASTNELYYEAVQKTAEANAKAVQAKFEALSSIAAAGDGQAASAAVMAMALTQTPTITPVPQQSQALQWASVLAAPVSNLGMMWMQNDATKTMAKYNARVDMARISADAQTEQSLYGSFVASHATTGAVAEAGFTAMGNVDYTPFVDGMVTLGTAGIDGAVTLGTAGFDSNVALGTAGLESAVTISNAGISGIADVSTVGFGSLLTLDQGNNSLVGNVWSDYTASIQEIMSNLPNVVCSVVSDGAGGTTVTCD